MPVVSTYNPDKYFKTSNTALAAYLIAEGFGTPDIDYNGAKAFFVFPRDNSHIEKCIREFETTQAEGNIVVFFNAYQSLIRRIKERY